LVRTAAVVLVVAVSGCGGSSLWVPRDGAVLAADATTDVASPAPDVEGASATDGGAPETFVATDADFSSDSIDAGASELPPPWLMGRRSYVVNAKLDAGPNASIPASHTFTLILDFDTGIVIAGSAEGGGQSAFAAGAGPTFVVPGSFGFSFGLGCSSDITYKSLMLTPLPDGRLVGTATGTAYYGATDVVNSADLSATFDGVPDVQTPALTMALGDDPTDPFLPARLVASEPLPPMQQLELAASGGERFVLAPTTSNDGGRSLSGFSLPSVLLRYGESYQVVEAGLRDFAGNLAKAGPTFTTRAAPPLVAEDGFESVTAPTLAGAIIADGTTGPTISGQRSLYLAPISSGLADGATRSQLSLRLAVNPDDTVIRFTYELVNVYSSDSFALTLVVAGVGTAFSVTRLPATTEPTTAFRLSPQTIVYVGGQHQATLPLPPGTVGEVFLDRVIGSSACGPAEPPVPGIVIDDLRVE
jgi:hypothetical protein